MSSSFINQPFRLNNTTYSLDASNNITYTTTRIVDVAPDAIKINNLTSGRKLEIGAGGFLCDGIPIDPLNLTAIAPNPTPTELVINNTLIVQDDDTAPNNIINIQAGINGGVGTFFGIDYESTTNQDFTIQSSSSGSLVYKQVGAGATTKQLFLNPTEIVAQDTNEPTYFTNITNTEIQISEGGTKNTTLQSDNITIFTGADHSVLSSGGLLFYNDWRLGDHIPSNAGINGTQQTLTMGAEQITIASGLDLTLNSGTQILIDKDCPQIKYPSAVNLATDYLTIDNTGSIVSQGTTTGSTKLATFSSAGFRGGLYVNDLPTSNNTYYLTFVQAVNTGGNYSGYYPPTIDSATLTYNPATNLLLVNGLQLSTSSNAITSFTANYLTIEGNSASNREFSFPITADMTGLTISNRRTNGVYKVMITNSSGASRTISSALSTNSSQPNKTSYATATIAVGDTWIMTIKVQNFAGTLYNCVSLEKFV
jgi:hypothetical protein